MCELDEQFINKNKIFPWIGAVDLQKNSFYLRKPVRDKTGLKSGDTALIIIVGDMSDPWNVLENLIRLTSGKFEFKFEEKDNAKDKLKELHLVFEAKETLENKSK